MNCTPSGMQGAIWVMFTQTLICNDKVNDGAYLAIETNFPEGTIANLGEAEARPDRVGIPAAGLPRLRARSRAVCRRAGSSRR